MSSDPGLSSILEGALLDRRIVLVNGSVDSDRATRVAAGLMTLDALGDDPIEIRLSAESDSLNAALSLMDTIDALGVVINATVAGFVGGTMVGVLAVCCHRRIGPLGRVMLTEPRASFDGVARDVQVQADAFQERVEDYVRRVAEACRQPFEHVEADFRAGRGLDARQALSYGLVDEIVARSPEIR